MSCIGSHLGFQISIKNKLFRGPSNDYSWAVSNNMLRLAEISKIFFSETNELD
jgi:hypothetical protein